jgi:hypothetical protein
MPAKSGASLSAAKCVSICTFVLVKCTEPSALLVRAAKCVSICAFVLVKMHYSTDYTHVSQQHAASVFVLLYQ